MAQWQYKLKIGDFYHKYPEELSIQEVAQLALEKINELLIEIRKEPDVELVNWTKLHYREEMLELADDLENEIIPQFEGLADNEDSDEEDFNYDMEDLYDWADTKFDDQFNGARMCFVDTF